MNILREGYPSEFEGSWVCTVAQFLKLPSHLIQSNNVNFGPCFRHVITKIFPPFSVMAKQKRQADVF